MVDSTRIAHPLTPPSPRLQLVDKSGLLSSPGLSQMQQIYKLLNGLVPTIACDCTGTNTLTLTPVNISPQVQRYVAFLGIAFVAADTSTGTVSAYLSLPAPTGDLDTLPVYKDNGGTAAGAGDIVAGRFYLLYFVDSVNSGNGGFVLK